MKVNKKGDRFKEVTLTVKVKVPEDWKNTDTAALVERLIQCGQEESEDSLDCDYDISDAEEALALELEVVNVSAQH